MNRGTVMYQDFKKLENIIDIDKFQQVQDNIARATDMAILTVDYRGVPITTHSYSQMHCTKIRELDEYRDLCQKCDSRGGLEAARLHKPYVYLCHRGLVDVAVPIVMNGQYLGAMMAGQVVLKDPLNEVHLERIVGKKSDLGPSEFELELKDMKQQLPHMTLEKVEAIASMLFHMSKYIVEEAAVHQTKAQNEVGQEPTHIANSIEELLDPALKYIDEHYHEHLDVKLLAGLCGISSSYFSKCFNQTEKMSISAYVNKVRIHSAKKLLKTTNTPVSQVADQMGYDSSGYFIKKFKEQVNMTPAQYRSKSR